MKIEHGRVSLELHALRPGSGTALLLLHELWSSSEHWDGGFDGWPGPVFALDFCGHGRSGHVRGGAYTPELLVGDADAALAQVGSAALVGAGVGAYVALLLAGARGRDVRGALLLPGRGLDGGGAAPDFERSEVALLPAGGPPRPADADRAADPMLCFLEGDVRPMDYAGELAQAAARLLLMEDAAPRPPWWEAARESPTAQSVRGDFARALALLAEGVE